MKTKLITLDGSRTDAEKITAAADVLDRGGLVVFPTETVYGIGCRAEKKSIDRLNKIKARTPEKHYTVHISNRETADKYVPKIPIHGKRLIDRAWPGPLTAVFQLKDEDLALQRSLIDSDAFDILYADRTVGLRCPDGYIAQQILNATSLPIVLPSANLSGESPAVTASEVIEKFDGRVDMIVVPQEGSGLEPRYKQSSTVAKVTDDRILILRQGAYLEAQIEEMSAMWIVFVCTGNICRSPMAELFAKKYFCEKFNCDVDSLPKKGYKIVSAGVMAGDGLHASPEVIELCSEKGIDAGLHRAALLDRDMIEKVDMIYTMAQSHRQYITELCPEAEQKCRMLDPEGDIADPIGRGMEVYRKCARQIEKLLKNILDDIL